MCPNEQEIWKLIPEWLTAIGTLAAVIVALYLSMRDKKIRCTLNDHVSVILDPAIIERPTCVIITVTNIGTRTFVFTGFGWRTGIFRRKHAQLIPPPMSKYSSSLPAKLADGDQASVYIPIESFVTTMCQPLLEGSPKFFLSFWVRFIRIIVNTTAGVSFTFRMHKSLRDVFLGKRIKRN